jgi:hypothetical protein
MHARLCVWLLWVMMNNKHQILAVVSDTAPLNQIAQCNDISGGTCAEPNFPLATSNGSLLTNQHRSAIAF